MGKNRHCNLLAVEISIISTLKQLVSPSKLPFLLCESVSLEPGELYSPVCLVLLVVDISMFLF